MVCSTRSGFSSAIAIASGALRLRRCLKRLVCDWSGHPFVRRNCNAHAERFVRSIKEECLDRIVPLGEWHFRRTLKEFIAHYHRERNHQGLRNQLIDGDVRPHHCGPVRRRERVGGILSYYYRAA
jgi:hypothetical protein